MSTVAAVVKAVFDITKIVLPSPVERWVTLGQLASLRPCGLQTREAVGTEYTPDQNRLIKSLSEGWLSSEYINIVVEAFTEAMLSGPISGDYYNHTRYTLLLRMMVEKKVSPDYLVQVRIYSGPLTQEQKLALYQRAKTALAPTQKNSTQHEVRDAWRIFSAEPSTYLIDKRGASRLAVAAGISETGGSHNRRDAAFAICRACTMLDVTPDVLFSRGEYQQRQYRGKDEKTGADKWQQTAAYIHATLDGIGAGTTTKAAALDAVKACFGAPLLAAPAKVEKVKVDLDTAAKNTSNALDRLTMSDLHAGRMPQRTPDQNVLLDALAKATPAELAAMTAACSKAAPRLFPVATSATAEVAPVAKPEATTHKAKTAKTARMK